VDLSIIVPCWNSAAFIDPCLISITRQTTQYHFETIFVIDPRTTDNTEERIKNKIPDAKIIHSKFQTAGLAREEGLKVATGRYVWFVDSDDWITSHNAVQTLIFYADQANASSLIFNFDSDFPCKTTPTLWRRIFNRSYLKDVHFDDARLFEDNHFLKAVNAVPDFAKHVYFININIYHYNWPRKGQITDGQILNEQ
jgi:glycosyltransferase involved in cell wall biosynthesis